MGIVKSDFFLYFSARHLLGDYSIAKGNGPCTSWPRSLILNLAIFFYLVSEPGAQRSINDSFFVSWRPRSDTKRSTISTLHFRNHKKRCNDPFFKINFRISKKNNATAWHAVVLVFYADKYKIDKLKLILIRGCEKPRTKNQRVSISYKII